MKTRKKSTFLLGILLVVVTLCMVSSCHKGAESPKIWYTSVVLDSASASVLRQYAEAHLPWQTDSLYYSCEHMTTSHRNDKRTDLEAWNLTHEGETVHMTATQVGYSDKAFAVKLECDIPVASGVPHVTLAVNQLNGGEAKDSRIIPEWTPLPVAIPLTGKIVVHYETPESIDR